LAVSPEGVEETVVGTSAGRSRARSEVSGVCGFSLKDEIEWGGEGSGGTAESEQDGRESDHVCFQNEALFGSGRTQALTCRGRIIYMPPRRSSKLVMLLGKCRKLTVAVS
jgi:hypothetical protein